MNRPILVAGLILMACCAAPIMMAQDKQAAADAEKEDSAGDEAKEAKGVAWRTDYDDALKEAAESEKFIFIEFSSKT